MTKNKFSILAIVFILIIFSLGGFLILKNRLNNQTSLVGGDSDEHGCKASAGYSWCEVRKKCLRIWEEPCVDNTNEDFQIRSDIKNAIVAKRNADPDNLEITILKKQDDYAMGGVGGKVPGMGGGMWFGVKTKGIWKLLWDGNGIIDCKSFELYSNYPTDFVPECFDYSENRMVTR